MILDISTFFEKHEWTSQQVDTNVWLSSFATEREEDFDLYVAAADDWLHFAISPFAPRPRPECTPVLYKALLGLNQQMRLVRFTIDEDGDVNLLADLPQTDISYAGFAAVLDTMVYYTEQLAHEVARTATQLGYRSAKF
ncbi:hypothetical protein GC175_18725 [bacterium]|nr:hypothetical protein [bacterium]